MNFNERTLRIHISGTSPYGFRLIKGSHGQIAVTKLRAKSKAASAGLADGDIITAINGTSCDRVNLERLMSLIEHAGHYVDLDVIRSSVESHSQPKPNPTSGALKRSHDWDSYAIAFDSRNFVVPEPIYAADDGDACYNDVIDNYAYASEDTEFQEDRTWPTIRSRNFGEPGNGVEDLRWNHDRSVTMQLSLFDDKENLEPAAITHRNEAFLVINSPPPNPAITSRRRLSTSSETATRAQVPTRLQEPVQRTPPDMLSDTRDIMFGPLPPEIIKIITPNTDTDKIPEELINTNKKIFADSSFYCDDKHNYPTVEEQIKMARKLAQSLTSPVNQDTRGHRMFMERMKNLESQDDITSRVTSPSVLSKAESSSLYYNPTPWQPTGHWERKMTTGADPPVQPPRSTMSKMFSAPYQISADVDESRSQAMSSEEFERVRLFDKKSTHDTVTPQLCFVIASDLHNNTSKGGQMFARRRAKSDQWEIQNDKMQSLANSVIRVTCPTENRGPPPAPLPSPPPPRAGRRNQSATRVSRSYEDTDVPDYRSFTRAYEKLISDMLSINSEGTENRSISIFDYTNQTKPDNKRFLSSWASTTSSAFIV